MATLGSFVKSVSVMGKGISSAGPTVRHTFLDSRARAQKPHLLWSRVDIVESNRSPLEQSVVKPHSRLGNILNAGELLVDVLFSSVSPGPMAHACLVLSWHRFGTCYSSPAGSLLGIEVCPATTRPVHALCRHAEGIKYPRDPQIATKQAALNEHLRPRLHTLSGTPLARYCSQLAHQSSQ